MLRSTIAAATLAAVAVVSGGVLSGLAGCTAQVDKNTNLGGSDSGPGGLDPTTETGGLDPGTLGETGPIGPLDPAADNDGDGYLYADDCNDRDKLVNPGAFDVVGDGVDNDCDGTVDNAPGACDTSLAMTSTVGMDFAKALGLCQTTDAAATGKNKRWGVVSAKLMTTDGKGTPMAKQYGIHPTWGSVVKPHEGHSMAVLSTGSARMPGQAGYMKPLNLFTDATTNANTPPAGWPKNSTGCPNPTTKTANDSVVLQLQIRVPTNAKSFTYDFDFFTSEYIDYVCSEFNDSYVAILKSGAPLDASHAGNISFDSKGSPINVNSGFFEVCTPGSNNGHSFACGLGTAELAGTGYSGDGAQDGATSWLRTTANVLPGETITVQFMIWNTGDHVLQSAIVLDNFQWSAAGTTAPVTDRPPM
jgi:hypothetical protein